MSFFQQFKFRLSQNAWPVTWKSPEEEQEEARKQRLKRLYPDDTDKYTKI